MRALAILLISLSFVLSSGCASKVEPRSWKREAASVGITEEEATSIARQATEHHKMVVAWFQRREDGGIEVYMHDTPERPHGVSVVFRKKDGRWQEDPKSKGEWIE